MSTIFGSVNYNADIRLTDLNWMMKSLDHWNADGKKVILNDNAGFGHLMLRNTPESVNEHLPYFCEKSKLLITADAIIDNREEIISWLSLDNQKVHSDSQLLLKAYQKWGKHCVNYIVGDFAFAIWDSNKQELFIARDHFGIKPVFYSKSKTGLVFSSEMKGILHYDYQRFEINEEWIADALVSVVSENDKTFYKNILRLPSGSYLTLNPTIGIKLTKYWNPNNIKKIRGLSEKESIELFRNKLNEVILSKLRSNKKVGCDLSGGLDSSIIAAFSSKVTAINTYSQVAPATTNENGKNHDEKAFINKVVAHCNITSSHYLTLEKENLIELMKHNIAIQDSITQQSIHCLMEPVLKKAAEDNVGIILSGFGGDQFLTSSGYNYFIELAKNWKWYSLWQEIREIAESPHKKAINKYVKYLLLGNIPWLYDILFLLQYTHRMHIKSQAESFAILPKFAKKHNAYEKYRKNKISYLLSRSKHKEYTPYIADNMVQRLEYFNLAAKSKKLSYRFPFLDKRLIELYLSFPEKLKYRNGYPRYLLRKVAENHLPDGITWRNDKSYPAIPSITEKFKNDYKQIRNFILEAQVRSRQNYVDCHQLLNWQDQIVNPKIERAPIYHTFFSSLQTLIFEINKIQKYNG